MNKIKIAKLDDIKPERPHYALVGNVDLVLVRQKSDSEVSVLYGRCLHRGALLSDGYIKDGDLICGLHNWDYRHDTGVSAYSNKERLKKFESWVDGGFALVDEDEIKAWERKNPQPYDRESYQGLYADSIGTKDEPHVGLIESLAENGLKKTGHHGPLAAMGVQNDRLPSWDDIQILTAQLHRLPLLDEASVSSDTVIGPNAKKPVKLKTPLFVSDMSFGALSEEAKIALAKGAKLAGTAICSGEGGMLAEENEASDKYFYELASARFGYSMDKIKKCQGFHFKLGQGAKTGVGGHLPGSKVKGKIAKTRGLKEGEPAISPSRFPDWQNVGDFHDFAKEVREETGGIPIGVKMSAQHIERDIDAALSIGIDYIILDGRGGGTGAAPALIRDNISVPTIPALARARRHLNRLDSDNVTLIITGGLRTPADFIKALALGADSIAISNAAMQAIGCIAMRACHTNRCPVGIATQDENLRRRIDIDKSAERLHRFLESSTELMRMISRACGHNDLKKFALEDISTFNREMAHLAWISYSGVNLGL